MFTMTFLGIITLGISTIMSVISLFIASKMSMERNLITPFECGFDPLSMLHAPFSMRFFTITLVFLVFDVEIALLLPLMNAMIIPSKSALIILISFINLLLLGTLWEWNSGTLLWKQ